MLINLFVCKLLFLQQRKKCMGDSSKTTKEHAISAVTELEQTWPSDLGTFPIMHHSAQPPAPLTPTTTVVSQLAESVPRQLVTFIQLSKNKMCFAS